MTDEKDYEVDVIVGYTIRVGVLAASKKEARELAKDAVFNEPLEAFDIIDECVIDAFVRTHRRDAEAT